LNPDNGLKPVALLNHYLKIGSSSPRSSRGKEERFREGRRPSSARRYREGLMTLHGAACGECMAAVRRPTPRRVLASVHFGGNNLEII